MSRSAGPLEGSFWVFPGRLLVGPHPFRGSLDLTRKALEALHQAGIRRILNLVEPGEGVLRAPYPGYRSDPVLIRVVRQGFPREGVPSEPELLGTLQWIRRWWRRGLGTCIHGLEDRGRVALVACAHLALEERLDAPRARARYVELGGAAGPEAEIFDTLEQETFLESFLRWLRQHRSDAGELTDTDRIRGGLLGFAVGSSVGAQVANQGAAGPSGERGPDARTFPQLSSDRVFEDTEIPLLITESYAKNRGLLLTDVFARLQRWLRTGPQNLGGVTREILMRSASAEAMFGVAEEVRDEKGARMVSGNTCLTRVVPVGLVRAGHQDLIRETRLVCAMIQADPICIESCQVLTHALESCMAGHDQGEVLPRVLDKAAGLLPSIGKKLEHLASHPPRYGFSGGYALDGLALVLQVFHHAWSFVDGVTEMINRGGDTRINTALVGALLGTLHGEAAIPRVWRDAVATRGRILATIDGLLRLRE